MAPHDAAPPRGTRSVKPTLSLIIPVRDGSALLRGCLSSIRAMAFPHDELEVLVVDNGSTDDTVEVARSLGVRVVRESRPGPYAARNLGARASSGEILGFTDADCILDPGWAEAAVRGTERFDAVCGLSKGAPGGPIARLVQERYEENIRTRRSHEPMLPVFDTRNAAVRRAVFERVGGFDDRLLDMADDLFGIAVCRIGGTLGFCEDMVVTHLHPESLRGVWARQVRHGEAIPAVAAWYPQDVVAWFPRIHRYGWLAGPGWGRRLGRVGAEAATSGLGWVLGLLLGVAVGTHAWGLARVCFDLFCRAGTVQGIARGSGRRIASVAPTAGQAHPPPTG